MSLEQKIQQWVSLDNQTKLLSEKLKELRENKNSLEEDIHTHLDKNDLSKATIKISDGQLRFVKTKETQQLTFRYLENCLSEIIKNEEQVKKIVEYIKNKREVSYTSEIKRIYS